MGAIISPHHTHGIIRMTYHTRGFILFSQLWTQKCTENTKQTCLCEIKKDECRLHCFYGNGYEMPQTYTNINHYTAAKPQTIPVRPLLTQICFTGVTSYNLHPSPFTPQLQKHATPPPSRFKTFTETSEMTHSVTPIHGLNCKKAIHLF